MTLKEKCIYYNPVQEGYYLVLSIDDEMIYGRRGDFVKTSNLEDWINQDGPGLRFKIDDIIINSDYIRNYYLDEKCLEQFELVKELTDSEFYPIEILSTSRYKYPSAVINIPTKEDKEDISELIKSIKYDETEINRMSQHIKELEKQLYLSMRCNIL